MLSVITPPAPYIALAEAKQQCRIEADAHDEDALVLALAAAACGWIDGPTGRLGRSIGVQTLELSGRSFADMDDDSCGIRLPCPPVIEVETVTWLDSDGAEQIVDDGSYYAADGRLWPSPGFGWPSAGRYANAARVRYRAGYPDTTGEGAHSTVPAPIRQATLLIVGFLYENREASGDEAINSGAVNVLLGPFQIWS